MLLAPCCEKEGIEIPLSITPRAHHCPRPDGLGRDKPLRLHPKRRKLKEARFVPVHVLAVHTI